MLRSIATSLSWRSPVITVQQTSEIISVALRVNWTKSLFWYPSRCGPHHSQQPSFSALSSWAIFFLWIRLSFIQKTHALRRLFSNCHEKKLCFYEPQFGRISLNFSRSDSVLRLRHLRQKCYIPPTELFQFVNYCRLCNALGEYRACWRHCCSLRK